MAKTTFPRGVKRWAVVASIITLLWGTALAAQASPQRASLPSLTIQSGGKSLAVTLNNAANPLSVPCGALSLSGANLLPNVSGSVAIYNGATLVNTYPFATNALGKGSAAISALSLGTYKVVITLKGGTIVGTITLTFYLAGTCILLGGGGGSGGLATPELRSGELLASSFVVIGAVLFYRRRRRRGGR